MALDGSPRPHAARPPEKCSGGTRATDGRGPAAADGPDSDSAASSTDLLPLVYEELRRLAHRQMAAEPAGHTLNPTALVHEAYLRLEKDHDVHWNSTGHFFGAAAQAMRRILVERARRYRRLKHGAGRVRLSLDGVIAVDSAPEHGIDILALDTALGELEAKDPRKHQIIMLRFFGGLTIDETARVLDVSAGTVKTDWRFARAWLFREMQNHAS